MPRVLMVCPNFLPRNAPDMHRVRILAPLIRTAGWHGEVLAADWRAVRAPLDPWLMDSFPNDVPVHRAAAFGPAWTAMPGMGGIAARAVAGLWQAGNRLLAAGRFDLVYFSTTAFGVHVLGPAWKRTRGVPFAMDYQDEWVTDYYREHPQVPPPGGRLKFASADRIARCLEPFVLRRCSGVTSVSPKYPAQLVHRYPWFEGRPSLVAPFPASKRDLEHARQSMRDEAEPVSGAEKIRWVYVGVVPPQMEKSIAAFFSALSTSAPKTLLDRLSIHFIGTSYAPGRTSIPRVAPIAARFGLAGIVSEQTDRVGYGDALRLLLQAEAVLAFGTDDPLYSASKIFPCLLARRPLLAIFEGRSGVTAVLDEVGGAVSVPFSATEGEEAIGSRIATHWLATESYKKVQPLDESRFEKYLDEAAAAELCRFFERCLA